MEKVATQANHIEQLRVLQQVYAKQLPTRLRAIEELLHAEAPEQSFDEICRMVHNIAGSAGTFGYDAVSVAARDFEGVLTAPRKGDHARDWPAIHSAFERLWFVAGAEPAAPTAVEGRTRIRQEVESLLYLISNDALLAGELIAQLQVFGWEVRSFESVDVALQQPVPGALLFDLDTTPAVAVPNLPLLAISSRWDWHSRLEAVQKGVEVYLRKPYDIGELVGKLVQLTQTREEEPYRVIIVDDMRLLAEHYGAVLRQAGIRAEVVTNAENLFQVMESFSPELILMDLYMPGCSGIEVSRVVRQDVELLSVPIVFLSAEGDVQRQLTALQTGADDFLRKPISDEYLVEVIIARAQRFRGLSTLMHRDSMTKLLNHTTIKLRLETELALAQRTGNPLSLVMLDIDHFKRVNDRHGHPLGDRVIKALANLLTQRLRKSDLAGRYGGEEFAIIMPNTQPVHAVQVMNKLREQFAQIVFRAPDQNFHCTFSAGVAGGGQDVGKDELIAAADAALYEAKHSGRDRVISAGAP